MDKNQFDKIIHLLESIDNSLKNQNRDDFPINFVDGVLIGITAGYCWNNNEIPIKPIKKPISIPTTIPIFLIKNLPLRLAPL